MKTSFLKVRSVDKRVHSCSTPFPPCSEGTLPFRSSKYKPQRSWIYTLRLYIRPEGVVGEEEGEGGDEGGGGDGGGRDGGGTGGGDGGGGANGGLHSQVCMHGKSQ